ncbi:N-acetylmuramoyl-L-alanine amidase family protein [Moorella sulfitireducens]|uniref:N-acetylmuramoyl-L-alanine amidase family protein n=1 Tax=Neomoorella sulfitireducens TaxID=2972948 RepID=UPI0021AD157F|nr:N-acetylmuramoyl-L-alanine amidase [Moorella sulfitireducens]
MARVVITPRRRSLKVMVALLAVVAVFLVLNRYRDLEEERAIRALSWAVANQVVVVDPGHGGIDSGAIGPGGNLEDRVNLAISRHLAGFLSQGGARVFLTRQDENVPEGETGDDLVERVRLAGKVGADLFISIHCNAFDNRERGAQIFYDPQSREGKELAEAIQAEIRRRLANTDRVPLSIDAFVLRTQKIPAVIVEVGFISNPQEEKLLADPHYQRQMAFAIYAGIVNYFLEGKGSPPGSRSP